MKDSIFSNTKLAEIFQVEKPGSDRLKSRENSMLEFKESFNWANRQEYAKTLAAFANNKGGYIVFGVTNSPRRLKGLQTDRFENHDPSKTTEFLNECFSPEIHWETAVHEIDGKKFGLFYVFECERKPVLCRKTGEDLKEGSIYFRYRGRSEIIKFPELRELLDAQRERDQNQIFKHLLKVAEVGVQNIGILNTQSGLVEGPGGSFLIDESLLPKIKFLREGHFSESATAPAVRLIGSAKPIHTGIVQPVKQVIRTKALSGQERACPSIS